MPPEVQSAGAMPVAGGATPPQSEPATPATGNTPEQTKPAATAGDDQLGEAGKKALADERAARKAAEKERDALTTRVAELENATKSEADKALAAAKDEGRQAADAEWSDWIRSTRVESALVAAGAIDPAVAAQAREFAALKVSLKAREVEGLDAAVEAFKAAHPQLFAAPGKASGDFGGGSRSGGSTPKPASSLEEAIAASMT